MPVNKYKFLGKRLLFVVAHPDDESFLASGLAGRNRLAGGKNCMICATLGENGRSHLKRKVTARQLQKIRKAELEKVAEVLMIDHMDFLGLPDGGLYGREKILAAKITQLIKQRRPEYVFSFDRDGISGHLDHITIGAVARAVAKKFGIKFVSFCIPPKLAKNFAQSIMLNRKHGKYDPEKIQHVEPNVILKIDPKVKLAALKCHRSQLDYSDPRRHSWIAKSGGQGLNYEYFRIY